MATVGVPPGSPTSGSPTENPRSRSTDVTRRSRGFVSRGSRHPALMDEVERTAGREVPPDDVQVLRLVPHRADVDREDLVELPVAEIRVPQ